METDLEQKACLPRQRSQSKRILHFQGTEKITTTQFAHITLPTP